MGDYLHIRTTSLLRFAAPLFHLGHMSHQLIEKAYRNDETTTLIPVHGQHQLFFFHSYGPVCSKAEGQ